MSNLSTNTEREDVGGLAWMRTRVKICGITRPEDALAAANAGADAIGLVFYPPSPRAVVLSQAQEIVSNLPPFVTVVGLFVDAAQADIDRLLSAVRIDLLQFHGRESPASCGLYQRPYIKALRMREGLDLHKAPEVYTSASALLLDTYRKGTPGGTGATFDWNRIPRELADSTILAGGLNPDNVYQAIRQVRPYAVDVSGGVELEKGIKSHKLIEAFIRGVRHADR